MTISGWLRKTNAHVSALATGLIFAAATGVVCVSSGAQAAESTFDVLGGAFGQNRIDSLANPQNQILHLPSSAEELEFRPDLRFNLGRIRTNFVFKPRLRGSFVQYEVVDAQKTGVVAISRGELNTYFNEGYVSIAPIKHFEVAAGIINYQWGSSDVLSVSQFIFPELILKPDPFQEIRGVEMVKAELQPSQQWTFTAMAELPPSGVEYEDALNDRKREFKSRALVRGEFASSNGGVLLGAVAGEKQTLGQTRALGGGYGFWNYSQGGQLYFDYIGQQSSERMLIDSNGNLYPQSSGLNSIYSIGVAGLRYAFENGIEFKAEFINNDFGISATQRKSALDQIRAGNAKTANYIAFLQDTTGPLPGNEYMYFALRIDDPVGLRRLFRGSRLTLRDLASIDDSTQALSLSFESALTDHFAQSLVGAVALGQDDGELTSTVRSFASYYVKYSY